MFTHGEVYANMQDNTISIKKFTDDKEKVIQIEHGNMDEKLIKDFFNRVKTKNNNDMKASVLSILNNHATAFAGEFGYY